MGDVSVARGATSKLGQVDGDLKVGQEARIESEDKVIQVTGRVSCDGDAEFLGSLSCSEFSARHGKVRIEGDLNAKGEVKVDDGQLAIDGSLEATRVAVDKALRIGGNARADDFDVGGVLEVKGTISGKKVDVGGSFKVQGAAEVEEIVVDWIAEGKYLGAIAKSLYESDASRLRLLYSVVARSLALDNLYPVHEVIVSAVNLYARLGEPAKAVFMHAVHELARRNDGRWTANVWFSREFRALVDADSRRRRRSCSGNLHALRAEQRKGQGQRAISFLYIWNCV